MDEELSDSEKRKKEAEEYQRGLLGFLSDVLKVGFWGVLFAGIAAIAGNYLLTTEWGKEMTQKMGVQGMLAANGFREFFGFEGIFDETAIKGAVEALETDEAAALFAQALLTTDFELSDGLLSVIADKKNRGITIQLLEDSGFAFDKPLESFSSATIPSLLNKALSGKHIEKGTTEYNFTLALLNAAASDIKAAKAVNPTGYEQATSYLSGPIFGDRENAVLNKDVLGKVIQHFPQQGIALFAALSKDETTAQMLQSPLIANHISNLTADLTEVQAAAIAGLLKEALQDSSKPLAQRLRDGGFLRHFDSTQKGVLQTMADTIELMNKPEVKAFLVNNQAPLDKLQSAFTPEEVGQLTQEVASAFSGGNLQDLLNSNALDTMLEDPAKRTAFKTFLGEVNPAGLPNEAYLKIGKNFLLANSDREDGKSHLDVILDLSGNPEAKAALVALVGKLSAGELNALADVQLSSAAYEAAFGAFQDLDIGGSGLLGALATLPPSDNPTAQKVASAAGWFSTAINSSISTPEGILQAASWIPNMPVIYNTEFKPEIRPDEQDDKADVTLGLIAGSALRQMAATR